MAVAPIPELVDFYLGLLVTAGDYALAIQRAAGSGALEQRHDSLVSALKDAGLAVQNYVEVATLARDPRIGFFGEEPSRSTNGKYFVADADLCVHLDPVNGACLHQHQRPNWDIVLSISLHRRLLAAVSYVPSTGRFYIGLRDAGALTGTRARPKLAEMLPLHTRPGSRHCLTYQTPEMHARLRGEFECFEIVTDRDPARGIDNFNAIYNGQLAAFACRDGACLGWGAAAFIATLAGARASRLDGGPLRIFDDFHPGESLDMIVAVDPLIHTAIMDRLAER
ncbi:MAG: hypothetical protein L6Q83_07255 [Gammaproteobacteria bacterium]|nr:hypothetical protein [Gammaproteobacteria bacterium]